MTGARLLPIGTVYDPFVNRGLDALIYACYQDARFLLVSTPSGLTLAPEGGQHQSVNTPLIGMARIGWPASSRRMWTNSRSCCAMPSTACSSRTARRCGCGCPPGRWSRRRARWTARR